MGGLNVVRYWFLNKLTREDLGRRVHAWQELSDSAADDNATALAQELGEAPIAVIIFRESTNNILNITTIEDKGNGMEISTATASGAHRRGYAHQAISRAVELAHEAGIEDIAALIQPADFETRESVVRRYGIRGLLN